MLSSIKVRYENDAKQLIYSKVYEKVIFLHIARPTEQTLKAPGWLLVNMAHKLERQTQFMAYGQRLPEVPPKSIKSVLQYIRPINWV